MGTEPAQALAAPIQDVWWAPCPCSRLCSGGAWRAGGHNLRVDLEGSPPADDWSTVKEMHQQYILSAAAASTPGFSIPAEWHGLTLHPNYVIAEGYPPARNLRRTPNVYAVFGPHADPADIARLTAFDLSCLTSLMPCRKSRDIMPEAAAQYAKEEPPLAQARKDHVCGPDIVALMARAFSAPRNNGKTSLMKLAARRLRVVAGRRDTRAST